MRHICIVTSKYPTNVDPTALTFVQQLAWSIAEQVEKVSVICPLPVNQNREFCATEKEIEEHTATGKKVYVYHPRYFTLGQVNVAGFNTAPITTSLFTRVVNKTIKGMKDKPEILYGHFFTPAGVTCCNLGKKFGIPAFIAYGESSPWTIDQLGRKRTKKMSSNVAGVVSVSSYNKVELAETGVVEAEKIDIFPNGYLPSRFHPKNKKIAREKFGFPADGFIVCFVGHFIERKGINILNQAMNRIKGAYLICAGYGNIKPTGDYLLYADRVNPNDLADFYSAADVFALPTRNEGCCNAIIEAMACGLPIVSSYLPFNDDILDETNSIRIDPTDVNAISEAIELLIKDSAKRELLRAGSLEKAKTLTLEARSANILKFIEKRTK
ncbi:glycosyltransferase family 4 protein [Sedimentibacter saalensis]|uniref:glycosyltransferase family 4 protein n=1 Tax=Sedimentibacter saalensis TaxID=130788 RepID=UPI002B20F3B3|nr:glycosyltransferase family 4 protein [Sedimentibacter saalensis]